MRLWEEFLQRQRKSLGEEVVEQWLDTLKVVSFDACNLYLTAKDAFQQLWFEEHIRPELKGGFRNGNGTPIKVHLAVANQQEESKEKRKKETAEAPSPFQLYFDEPASLCTLENFVSKESNPLPVRLLHEISLLEGATSLGTFNPIYLHGSKGTGKSHLLAAMTQALSLKGVRTLYVRTETFTEHVIKAIRAGEMHTFRQAYRNIDLLAIDDIHLLARKGATQEELFHTFNTLHTAGKQILLSASVPPAELQHIEPRLVSRFEWGIVLELTSLEGKEYAQLLRNKCEALGFPLSPRLETFLLETFPSNAKALVRAVEALILRSHLSPQNGAPTPLALTLQQARHYLSDLIKEEESSAITTEKILRHVAEHYGIKVSDILGKAQSRDCSLPRQLVAYLCRQLLKMPYKQIGDLLSRDHSTIMTSIKQIQKQLDNDNAEVIITLRQVQYALREAKEWTVMEAPPPHS